jgi:hypothetical protein
VKEQKNPPERADFEDPEIQDLPSQLRKFMGEDAKLDQVRMVFVISILPG